MSEDNTAVNLLPEVERQVEREIDQFFALCPPTQDPVLSIVRMHLLAEYYMERLLGLLLPRGDRLARGRLTFSHRLLFLEALDALDDRTAQALKNLNSIRNACAHEMNRQVTVADIDRIGRPFGSPYAAFRREHEEQPPILLVRMFSLILQRLLSKIIMKEHELIVAGPK